MLHRDLERQLAELGLDGSAPPDTTAWQALLARIGRSYTDADRLRAMFETAAMGIWSLDLDGRVADVNPALERLLGYTAAEMRGRFVWQFVHEDQAAGLRAYYGAGGAAGRAADPTFTERRYLTKAGAVVHAMVSVSSVTGADGRPLLHLHLVEDVTEQRRLEIELRHAQKLETVGRLAAGVAHEINTPIQFVGDNASFLREAFTDILRLCQLYREACGRRLSPDEVADLRDAEEQADIDYLLERVPSALEATQEGARRVATIVKAMKSFAHPDRAMGKAAGDINQAIRSTVTVATSELKYVADVELDLGELPPVPCMLGDLNQVFLNLLVNAAHAIGDVVAAGKAKRGTIRVTSRREPDSVVVAVSDTGTGIPPEVASHVFDPFFTTKEVGRGTGQGLALSRSVVVEKHGGTLTFETEVGRGTTFFVRLPLGDLAGALPESAASAS